MYNALVLVLRERCLLNLLNGRLEHGNAAFSTEAPRLCCLVVCRHPSKAYCDMFVSTHAASFLFCIHLLLLDHLLDAIDGVGGLHAQGDGRLSLHEDLLHGTNAEAPAGLEEKVGTSI